jgi:hypothetical protein
MLVDIFAEDATTLRKDSKLLLGTEKATLDIDLG